MKSTLPRSTQTAHALLALTFLLVPCLAQAHPGHTGNEDGGIGWGMAHPFTGIDHVLAAVGIGVWAAMSRGLTRSFLLAGVILGGLLGMFCGIKTGLFPQLEALIGMSVIFIAAGTIKSGPKHAVVFPFIASAAAFLHGWAHGAEVPADVSQGGYLFGVVMGTVALMGVGMIATRRLTLKTSSVRRNTAGNF